MSIPLDNPFPPRAKHVLERGPNKNIWWGKLIEEEKLEELIEKEQECNELEGGGG